MKKNTENTEKTVHESCQHDTKQYHPVCTHIFKGEVDKGSKYFTGKGWELAYYCQNCADTKTPPMAEFCDDCIEKLEEKGYWEFHGKPGIIENIQPFRFTRRTIPLSGPHPARILIMQPLTHHPTDAAIVDDCGELSRVNILEGRVQKIMTLTSEQVRLDGLVSMVLSQDNSFVAITSQSKDQQQDPFNFGVVIDLDTGQQMMSLKCGDYHVEHTPFPVNFIEYKGKMLIIHATDWNRLDVSDPRTGECLTQRDFTLIKEDEDFYDDSVFSEWYGELAISPSQQKIASIGWVWHPLGVAFSWSAKSWLEENVWEADNGKSKRSYCIWDYFWYSPFFWYDDNTLCIWGSSDYQKGSDLPIDSVVLYNAETEQAVREFAGPTLDVFYYDHYLFSGLPEKNGISIWDLEEGALLHRQPGISPRAYHPGTREFIEIDETGWYGWHWEKDDCDPV